MRVLPISNFNKSIVARNNRKIEKPPVETVQNNDTVSFKGSYKNVYQASIRKKLSNCMDCAVLFDQLKEAVMSERLSFASDYYLKKRISFLRDVQKSNLTEDIAISADTGRVLMNFRSGSINFFDPEKKCLPITFWADGKDFCIERPGNEYNYEDLSTEIYTFRAGDIINGTVHEGTTDLFGTIKEYDFSVPGHGYTKQIFYDKEGRKDFWKTFLFGAG